jgi:GMP synthase PP-ATPase subunit
LFGDFLKGSEEASLAGEKAYTDYAKQIGGILNKEERKKHVQAFFVELLDSVYSKMTSAEYQVEF